MRVSEIYFVVTIICIVFLCKCKNGQPQYLDLETTIKQNILWNMQNLKVGDTLKLEYPLKTYSDGSKLVYLSYSFYSPDTSIIKVEPYEELLTLQGELLETNSQDSVFKVRVIERDKHEINLGGYEVGDTLDVWLKYYGRKIEKTTSISVPNKGS